MVGGSAAPIRADEARPRAASVPGEVRPPAGRGLPRTATSVPGTASTTHSPAAGRRSSRRTRSAPMRSDATSRRSTAFWPGQDGGVLAGRARARSARRAGGSAPVEEVDPRLDAVAAPVVCAAGARRAARVPARSVSPDSALRRRRARHPLAGGPLRPPDDSLRPRLPARAGHGAVQCRKHKRECRPVDRGVEVPGAVHDRHRRADPRVRASAEHTRRRGPARGRAIGRARARRDRRDHVPAVPRD